MRLSPGNGIHVQRKRIPIRLVVAKTMKNAAPPSPESMGFWEVCTAKRPGEFSAPATGVNLSADRHHRKEVERELFAYLGTPR